MKKVFAILLLAVFTAATVSAKGVVHTPTPTNKKMIQTFENEFPGIQNVEWKEITSAGLFRASFVHNDQSLNAYFTEEGELVAIIRNITKEQLPLVVVKSLDEKFGSNATYSEMIESNKQGTTYYYAVVVDANNKKYVEISNEGSIDLIKKEKNKD